MPTNGNALACQQGAFETTQQSNYTTKKRYPPYGKLLNQLRLNDLTPCMRVIVSTRWELGGAYPRIVIPNDIPAANLNFSYLAGLSVQIVHGDDEPKLVRELIEEILKIEPKELIVCNYDLAKNNYSGKSAYTLICPESPEVLHGT